MGLLRVCTLVPSCHAQGGRSWCRCDQCAYAGPWCDKSAKSTDTRLISGGWYIENVFEELDADNEFFYNATTEILYFKPNATTDGPSPKDVKLVVPVLETIVKVSLFSPLHTHIHTHGCTHMHTHTHTHTRAHAHAHTHNTHTHAHTRTHTHNTHTHIHTHINTYIHTHTHTHTHTGEWHVKCSSQGHHIRQCWVSRFDTNVSQEVGGAIWWGLGTLQGWSGEHPPPPPHKNTHLTYITSTHTHARTHTHAHTHTHTHTPHTHVHTHTHRSLSKARRISR
jgi:hypothetical protein